MLRFEKGKVKSKMRDKNLASHAHLGTHTLSIVGYSLYLMEMSITGAYTYITVINQLAPLNLHESPFDEKRGFTCGPVER